jgi:hypothetical protein
VSAQVHLLSRPAGGRATLVIRVGAAPGAREAAAALACCRSDPGRAGLLIDLGPRRSPRPTLIASPAARELEERLAGHLPEAGVASRGWTCHLALPADRSGIRGVAAALPLVEDSIAAVNLPPQLLQVLLEEPPSRLSGVLLRADLGADRALAALATRDLMGRGLCVAVLKRPLGWLAARRALAGLLPAGSRSGLPPRLCERLLAAGDPAVAERNLPVAEGDLAVAERDADLPAPPRIQFRM